MKLFWDNWDKHFLVYELRLVVFLEVGMLIWAMRYHGLTHIDALLDGNRVPIYTAAASIFGALFGFVITALSVVISVADNPGIALLRKTRHYQDLWDVFTSSIKVLSLTTIASIAGLVLDRDASVGHNYHPISYVFYVFVFFTMLSIARLSRCVWALKNLVNAIAEAQRRKTAIEEANQKATQQAADQQAAAAQQSAVQAAGTQQTTSSTQNLK